MKKCLFYALTLVSSIAQAQTINIVNVENGETIKTLLYTKGRSVTSIAFTNSNGDVAVGIKEPNKTYSIELWKGSNKTKIPLGRFYPNRIYLDRNESKLYLAGLGKDNIYKLDILKAKIEKKFLFENDVELFGIYKSRTIVAMDTEFKSSIMISDIGGKEQSKVFKTEDSVRKLSVSSFNEYIAWTGSNQIFIAKWNNGSILKNTFRPFEIFDFVFISSDKLLMAVRDRGAAEIVAWNFEKNEKSVLLRMQDAYTGIYFSPDLKKIVTRSYEDKKLQILRLSDGRVVENILLKKPLQWIYGINFDDAGKHIVFLTK